MPKDLAHIEAVGQRHPIRHDVVAPEMPVGSTIAEIVGAMDLDTERYGLPVVTMIRGGEISVVPLDMWGKTRPLIGTRVEVAFPVRDPGSIALIASLAIPQAATAIAGAFYAVGTVGYALIAAAVTIVGTLLVQALIPPAKTEGSSGIQNYAITGTQNAANPYGVFPTVLGRHRIYPPLTATGFSENAGQDVYYYGRMTFGYGPIALEDLRIGTTPITEFAAAEVELEFRNVDRELTLAAMPGLAPFVVDRTGEENKPRFKLTEVGKTWTFAPRAAADQVTIEFNVSAQDKISGYTFIVEETVSGSGIWAQVASFTLQDPVTNHDPLSGLQETRTFTSASYSDGVEREYRVTLTGSTPRTGDYIDNWLTFFSGKGVDAVTITKASATYHEVQPGWRYGTDSMFLYPEDITQDDENALPEPGSPVVRYTREASSAASVDISFSRGLYDGTDDGLEAYWASFEIYYQNVAGGIVEEDWVLAASPTYEAKSTTALRYTVPMSFPEPGQYAIKVERINSIDGSTRDQNRAWVTAIRSMSGEPLPSPEGIAEVAFKIKASDQLNGRLDSLNGIVQQLAPVWDGSAWTDPQPVRHPAWLYAQALRGPQQRRPVADSRLDLDAIKAWADQEPHWTCDYVIDTPTQTAEVLDVICAAGRARRTLTDFRWSVIRDGAAGPVRQTFTPRNSWGYSAKHRFPREIHGFRVKVRSERLEWEEDEILVLKDGFTRETATELETLQLAGTVVTADDEDEGNAYRLGRYHLAVAENRPETHTFFADWEHIRVQRGDKIRFVHDVPMIGRGQARITGITEDGSGNVATITLDELFDFERDSFRLAVRNVQAEVIFQALSPEDPRTRVWTPEVQVTAADIAVGDLVAVEETEQASAEMLVTGIYPRKDESAKITCVDAAPAILQAAVGTIPTYSPVVTNPREAANYGLPPTPVVISTYSDATTQITLPDLSTRPRIAVQLAPFASRLDTTGMQLQLRWREQGSGAPYTYGQVAGAGQYQLFTDALDEGVSYEGQVRATASDGKTRGWVDWSAVVTASMEPPAPPLITAVAAKATVPDANGDGRRPAISLSWTVPANNTLRVTWQLRIAATGVVVQRGLFAEASEGQVPISDGVLPDTAYQIRASFVSGAADLRTWGGWLDVTTDDIRLTEADLDASVSGKIDEASARHDQALEDVESGTIRELLDNIEATFGTWQTFDGLPLIDAIEVSIGSLTAPVSLSSEIQTERERLDITLPRITDVEATADDLWQNLTALTEAQFATDIRISDAGIYVDPESGTVKIAAFEYLEDRVSDVSIELDAARAQIELKASVAYVNQALSELVLDPTQIPIINDLTARVSTVEIDLDAVEGTVSTLADTLTVEGGLVTMTTVTQTLDSLQGQITDRVTSATFDAAEARWSAAEQTISAFPDEAIITSAVEATRVLSGDLDDVAQLSIIETWERFSGDDAIRVAVAQGRSEMRAYIDESDTAIVEDITELRSEVSGSVAQIEQTLETRASEAEAAATAITQLQADKVAADGERAAQADALDELSTRVTETEDGLEAEAQRQTILTSSVRDLSADQADYAELGIVEAWSRWQGEEDLRDGIAVAASQLHTFVVEGLSAAASERLVLGAALADANAEIVSERTARVTQDEALAQDIVQLSADLENVETVTSGFASAISNLDTRVTSAEGAITAQASDITDLQADVSAAEGEISGNSSAISGLDIRVSSAEGGITAQASDISDLQSALSAAEGSILANASAVSGLETRVSDAEGIIAANSSDISQLSSGLSSAEGDIAGNASAISALDTRVTSAEGTITSNASDITQLQSDLTAAEAGISGNATAISSFDTRLISASQSITAQASDISQLQSDLTAAEAGISGNATAISSLDTRVTNAEGSITAQASDISDLQSDVSEVQTGVSGNAAAIAGVETRVTSAEGSITSQASDISQLQSDLTAAEGGISGNATAISNLDTRVTSAEGAISSQASDITSLQSGLSTAEGGISGNVSAISGLDTRVTSAEGAITSEAGRIDSIEATLNTAGTGVLARISTIEGAYVDSAGAVSAVEQQISASYGDLSAMASATAFAKAQADGIEAGYVWRLNGANVMEMVSVSDGTSGATITYKIAADYVQITGLTQINQAVINNLAVNSGFIENLQIGRGQITNTLQSDNFVAGDDGDGLLINFATGYLEGNNIKIRRQIEIASGSIYVGDFLVGTGEDNGSDNGLNEVWATAVKRVFAKTTPVSINAWGGAKRTYIATAGMGGQVFDDGNEPDTYWGWEATVLPLTRWSGDQSLRLKFDFWQRNVLRVENCTIYWKIYEVS